jgi:pimeloyl-ACP methyl ester carboxylesterase
MRAQADTQTGALTAALPGPSRPAGPMAVTTWGASGPPAVLVHGGGAGGAAAFASQRPLARDHRLVLPDRPGTGGTPAAGPQDAVRDGALVAELLEGGAHLVGHSYGAVVAMVAAAAAPDRVRSLTLIEPPAFQLAGDDPVVLASWEELAAAVSDPDPGARVRRFFAAAGVPAPPDLLRAPPAELPAPLRHLAADLATMRQPWDVLLDLAALRRLPVPKVVVSGGHREAFERLADRLAGLLDAGRAVLAGAGHAVQDTGDPFNSLLRRIWA